MHSLFKFTLRLTALAVLVFYPGTGMAANAKEKRPLAPPLLKDPALPSQAETLESAWREALANAHRLKASQKNTESSRETLSSARAAYLPSFNVEGGKFWMDRTLGGQVSVPGLGALPLTLGDQISAGCASVSVPLFTSGRISNGVAAAKAGWRAAQAEEQREVLDLKITVAEAYLNVLRATCAVRVASSHVTSLASHCENVADMHAHGLVTRNDVLASQVALADARQQAIKADNDLDLARASYNRLLVRPLTQPVIIEDMEPPRPPGDLSALTQGALQHRPELTAYAERATALRREARSIRASALPTIGATASYNRIDADIVKQLHADKEFLAVGIVGSWNVFDSGLTIHKARAVDEQAAAMESMRAEAAGLIGLQVRQTWLNIRETLHRLDVTRRAILQAEENLSITLDRYKAGNGTNTEVLDAETLRVRTLGNNDAATYDSIFAALALRRAVGDLY